MEERSLPDPSSSTPKAPSSGSAGSPAGFPRSTPKAPSHRSLLTVSKEQTKIALQLLLAEGLYMVREFSIGYGPSPRQILGIGLVFGAISVTTLFGEEWAHLGSLFGWLVILALAFQTVKTTPLLAYGIGNAAASRSPLFPEAKS